jgi:ribosomal protein L40E
MFCSNCGAQIENNSKFCPNCGAAQNAQQANAQSYRQAPVQSYAEPIYSAPVYAGNGAVRNGIPAPGYSDRVNHPEILAAVSKNRKTAGVFAFFLVPLPLIGFMIYSIVSGEMELSQASMIGGLVSAVFLIFALYGFITERAKNTYEATVIDKKTRREYRHNNSDDTSYYTQYITVVRSTDGKTRKIVERDGSQIWAWDYLQMGERFKYHPQFHFPYELFDKSKAPYIACVNCPAHNPVEADRCRECGLPLLK